MSTAVGSEPLVQSVEISDETITAHLADGRCISVPLAWSWRLSKASPQQRQNFRIVGTGEGIHWPDIDEDISVRGMLDGIPARRPAQERREARRQSGDSDHPSPK